MDILESSWDLMFKLGQLIEYYWRNVFIEKLCIKCLQQSNSRPLFKIVKWPKSANPIGTIFCRYGIQKGDCPISLKNVILFFTLNPVLFFTSPWTPFLGFKIYLKLFFMQRSITWPIFIFWLKVVSELFRKTFLLIYVSHLIMS